MKFAMNVWRIRFGPFLPDMKPTFLLKSNIVHFLNNSPRYEILATLKTCDQYMAKRKVKCLPTTFNVDLCMQ
jgi:hypothetical protein